MFGPSHWGALVVFALGSVALVWWGRRQSPAAARLFGRVLGGLTAAIYLPVLVYGLVPFDARYSLPLHLTDLATVVTAYAWWSQRQWAFAVVYYWGLVLSVQALISPALTGPDFPHYRYLGFWSIHLLVVWAAIYLTWGRGMRPGWADYRRTVAISFGWAAVAFVVNGVVGANYGFVNGKPSTPSLLDVLGPWPWYLLVVAASVCGVWARMTWRGGARAAGAKWWEWGSNG
nr:MAG: TIGR02206 family membrane protein [Mycolicibacterium hassiacum]